MTTILEEAVAQAVPLLDTEGADKQILALLRQVGELEIEAAAQTEGLRLARHQNSLLAARNAALEDAIEAISAFCFWRLNEVCFPGCPGREFCDVTGLTELVKPNMRGV